MSARRKDELLETREGEGKKNALPVAPGKATNNNSAATATVVSSFIQDTLQTAEKSRAKRHETEERRRAWRMIFYTESLPENWRAYLTDDLMWRWACSPLHDSDKWSADDEKKDASHAAGTLKKAHYHIVAIFGGKKSFSQINAVCQKLGQPIPMPCDNPAAAVQYFVHKNDSGKFQYSPAEICGYNGFPVQTLLEDMGEARSEALTIDVMNFVRDRHLTEFYQVAVELAEQENREMFNYFRCHTIFFSRFIDSFRNAERDAAKMNLPGKDEAAGLADEALKSGE